jgi:hypothetical protein
MHRFEEFCLMDAIIGCVMFHNLICSIVGGEYIKSRKLAERYNLTTSQAHNASAVAEFQREVLGLSMMFSVLPLAFLYILVSAARLVWLCIEDRYEEMKRDRAKREEDIKIRGSPIEAEVMDEVEEAASNPYLEENLMVNE